ncbi:MAG: hypothetical protein DMG14_25920 [Acidobacteria bacterium]|nr:MAG: hypothetical protein DMG14_25920 [Acidobacteriota bacterium]
MPRNENLRQLRFKDALNDSIALSELAMDMVEAFSSREELIWIQNGFKPIRKIRRVKPRRSRGRS